MTDLFRDERGITSVSMAVALFISIALIFSGAQLYRVHSAAAEVQEVADACALAADNEVAGLMTVANVCDAVCLSLTLMAATLYGLGLVAACVPAAESVSVKLMDLAQETVKRRQEFYDRACQGLNAAQRALPFLATGNASAVAKANEAGALQADHTAVALLVPADFEALGAAADDGLEDAASTIDEDAESIRSKAKEAEEAAAQANAAKERGFREDCGADPAYCMRERADALAGLSGEENPAYASVDTWSFSVALERARAYYRARLASWTLEGRSTEAQADAVIRKRFYEHALSELADAYVDDGPEGFSAHIPHLFRNTDEMRSTSLYAETIYPVTEDVDGLMMHAWSGCPRAAGSARAGSIQELEASRSAFRTCPACRFVPSSVGSVAAASTSIQNGFENHYEQMRQACEGYEEARAKADPLAAAVKDEVSPLLDALASVLDKADLARIHLEPPGRDGVIAVVANTAQSDADTGFQSAFVASDDILGCRVAVSSATTVEDGTESAGALVTEALGALGSGSGGVGTAAAASSRLWMSLLHAYEDGQAALVGAVQDGLASFSQTSASGLGSWAAAALTDIVEAAGLEPADTACQKPVVLNTAHVASASDDALCVRYRNAKEAALAGSSPSTSLISTLFARAADVDEADVSDGSFSVVEVELPLGGNTAVDWRVPEELEIPDALGAGVTVAETMVLEALGDMAWQ